MSNRSDRKKRGSDATASFLRQKYQTDMGQKVLVERHKIDNERMGELREVLRDIGKDIQQSGVATREIDYLGSFSVHVYYSKVMQRMEFATLSAPDLCSSEVAESASAELFGSICETFGKPRPMKRSGSSG